MSMFMAAESIRRGEKDPLSWIVEEVMVSQMDEKWKEAMTPKTLCLVEPQERAPKHKPKPARAAWEECKEAERQAALAKRLLRDEASHKGEDAEMPRIEQRAFLREVRARQAVRQAKVPVQAPQPVIEEKEDDMEEDVDEAEDTR